MVSPRPPPTTRVPPACAATRVRPGRESPRAGQRRAVAACRRSPAARWRSAPWRTSVGRFLPLLAARTACACTLRRMPLAPAAPPLAGCRGWGRSPLVVGHVLHLSGVLPGYRAVSLERGSDNLRLRRLSGAVHQRDRPAARRTEPQVRRPAARPQRSELPRLQCPRAGLRLARRCRAQPRSASNWDRLNQPAAKSTRRSTLVSMACSAAAGIACGVATVAQGKPGEGVLRPASHGFFVGAPRRQGGRFPRFTGGLEPRDRRCRGRQAVTRQGQHRPAPRTLPGRLEAGEVGNPAPVMPERSTSSRRSPIETDHHREVPARPPGESLVL